MRAFDAALESHIGKWDKNLPIMASGMITSRQGWVELPYVACPAGLQSIAAAVHLHTSKHGRKIYFVPGISTRGLDGAPDVIRGEETQVLGASEGGNEHFVTPGTHSKWITVKDREITGFSSYMTGEVFALLKTHSILGKLMTGETASPSAFERGVRAGLKDPAGFLHNIFSTRTLALFNEMPTDHLELLSLRPGDRHRNRPCHCEKSGGRTVSDIGNSNPWRALHDGHEDSRIERELWQARCGSHWPATHRRCRGAARMTFADAISECGLIAILRGITTAEVEAVGQALVEAGIRVAEIPLNSPDPFASIEKMATAFKGKLVVGAGTVLSVQDVNLLKAHGGQISVSPDCNEAVIARARELGLEPVPGVFTPTEAFAAIRAGATHLKLFPAEAASPLTVKAWRAVLPKHVKVYAVGGVTPANMQGWVDAGVAGFGIGSNIYKQGATAAAVAKSAKEFITAWRALKS